MSVAEQPSTSSASPMTEGAKIQKAKIRAEFVLDGDRPTSYDSGKHTHYKIALWIDGAPEDTHAVNYELHESYRDPLRESRTKPEFDQEITSYGDYVIRAKVRRRRGVDVASAKLADALEETYGSSTTPEIKKALDSIRAH